MIELGIFARTFSGTLHEVFKSVQDAGLKTIQFNFSIAGLPSMPDAVDETTKNRIRTALHETPLKIEAVSGTFNMIHPDRNKRIDGLRRLRIIAEQCKWLDTKLITLCTGTRNTTDKWKADPENNTKEAWYDLRETLELALVIAEEFDLYLGVEPETANVINTIDKAFNLLKEVNSPHLKIVFDPANIFENESPDEIKKRIEYGLDVLGEHIISTHAKDRDQNGNVVAAGKGVLPYQNFLQGLKKINYQGNLIIHGLDATEVQDCVIYIRRQLESTA
jgi:sugar phosphate isomerase/epimerase